MAPGDRMSCRKNNILSEFNDPNFYLQKNDEIITINIITKCRPSLVFAGELADFVVWTQCDMHVVEII